MAKTLISLLLAMGAAHAQSPRIPFELSEAASRGNKAALQKLRTLSEQGDANAQNNLGVMYQNGLAVPKDAGQAVNWFRKSAERGLALAQENLGLMYAKGEGVSKDLAQALQWFRKAAEQGIAEAQNNLGVAYRDGEGMPKDAVQAVNWFRKATEQGNADAQNNLGVMYTNGEGVTKDTALAVQWYRKAAEQGIAAAQYNLGLMYERGQGVPKDAAQAVAWYRKATEQGNANAQSRLSEMDAKRSVPMLREGGVYVVPVLINNAITLNFVVDSGAADVSIPADVVTTLMRTGTITQSDFIGARTYTLADGSRTSSRTFRIRSLKVGDIVLQDVIGSVANRQGDLLLGQSFLGRFKSWSIDNTMHTLVLE